jgi:hypothetical protein
VGGDPSVVCFDERLGDREPDPGPAAGRVEPVEAFEQVREVFGRDAVTGGGYLVGCQVAARSVTGNGRRFYQSRELITVSNSISTAWLGRLM